MHEPRRPDRLRGSSLFRAAFTAALLSLTALGASPGLPGAQGLVAQEEPAAPASQGPVARSDQAADEGRSFWSIVAGERVDRRRLTLVMFAMHPFEPQFPELDWTWGVAFSWSQWFLSTFINSYDERSWIAGIERSWARGAGGPFEYGLGYRVGVVTGYDERLISWAEHTPVLPFAGVLLWSDVGPVGVDVYYVYRAITLEASVRF